MEHFFLIASLWLGMAVLAAIAAHHLKISIALVEIVLGVFAAWAVGMHGVPDFLGQDEPWLKALAGSGAVLLTFLAGAELDPQTLKTKWKEVSVVGLVGFIAPFLGCAAASHYLAGWGARESWLAGIALSTTSMAVVYAVMLETGLNRTEFGKGILGACFINDLGTVIALGLIFAPFTRRTAIFVGLCAATIALLPWVTRRLTDRYGFKTAAIRTKWIIFVLFGLGAAALWAGSEAVLPAYLVGMALAEFSVQEALWLRRLRTLTVGFLTPFYFLRAGTLVVVGELVRALPVFGLLFGAQVASKIFGLFPFIGAFRTKRDERWYYTLLMSTGLTFGTISALYGLSHGIITQAQYSLLVAAVIASAVIPTLIAGLFFLPKHLLPGVPVLESEAAQAEEEEMTDEG